MSETSFDISDIEPAKVQLIEDKEQGNDEEQLQDGTLPGDSGNPEQRQQEEQAATADSETNKNLQSAFTKVSQENSELRNRLSQMESMIQQMQKQNAPRTRENSFDTSQQSQPVDELDAVDKEFEELKPVNKRIRQLEEMVRRQSVQINHNQRDYTESTELTAKQLHEQKILAAHSDAFDIAQTADFTGWLARQPSYMRQLTRTGTAEDIISLITTYKSSAPSKVDDARRMGAPNAGSSVIKNIDSGKPTFTGQQIHDMSDAEFIRREAEIQEAQMDGRVFS